MLATLPIQLFRSGLRSLLSSSCIGKSAGSSRIVYFCGPMPGPACTGDVAGYCGVA